MGRSIQYFLQVWASDINNLDGTTNTLNKSDTRDIKKEVGLQLPQKKIKYLCVHDCSPACRNVLG